VTQAASFRLERTAADVLSMSGDLVFETAAVALGETRAAIAKQPAAAVELAGLDHADSAGLAVLIALVRDSTTRASRLTLRNPPEGLLALAHLCDVEDLLGLAPPVSTP
jgi:phospholipid transport system transporter-binding protein